MTKKKNNTIKTGILLIIPLCLSAYLYFYTLYQRASIGYFVSPKWIFLNTISYLIFWSVTIVFIGYFLNKYFKKIGFKK